MEKLTLKSFKHYLKPRARNSHKDDFGRVLIIGGSSGFSGAMRLAGEAALRVGAGCVTIATHPQHAAVLNVTCPELMCHAISSASDIKPLLSRITAIVIGPGLGIDAWGKNLFERVLSDNNSLPMVIDADGLTSLAQLSAPIKKEHWILTPHPGEAARLLKTTAQDIQQDRVNALKKLHTRYGGTIVLKGAGTLTISNQTAPEICTYGNPGMATAGMGDVLSGMIGGLLAQHLPLQDAARLGVLLHAIAGDHAAKQGQRGMIASDVLPYLRELINP